MNRSPIVSPKSPKQVASMRADPQRGAKETPSSNEAERRKSKTAAPYRPWLLYFMMSMLVLWVWQALFSNVEAQSIAYSEFKKHLAAHEVVEVAIAEDQISGLIMPGGANKLPAEAQTPHVKPTDDDPKTASRSEADPTARQRAPWYLPFLPPSLQAHWEQQIGPEQDPGTPKPWMFRTVRVEDSDLISQLQEAGVRYTGVRPSAFAQVFWSWILPLLFFFFLWSLLSRRFSAVGSSVLGFGKSRAKLSTEKNTGVNFGDVAGCDEAKHELIEVVNFLKSPERYQALGAKIPKGVLLVGPPGTGKTLLARAVAGEAGVPFFSISGSDFVEMFVGVGAARVRDLFEQAKKQQPCIVFIDEIDTIGRHRGVHMGMTNDEREQTLNQLLNEMDGFEPNAGIIIIAATNRPEVLDRALLRPGRFDRQVVVDAPDVKGREAILKVHARGKPLAPDVDLARVAKGTPGFSGADLANTMNEAALLATTREHRQIFQRDLEDAIEKVVAGPERKSRRLSDNEKRRVAFHESGHALVAAFCEHADPVHKISIVPRGRAALGYTLQLPEGEQYLLTRSELLDRIRGLLGGRAAEEIIFGEVSTGAENDLDKATALARQMVTMYGMGDKIGLAHVGQRQRSLHLAGPGEEPIAADCSQETAREIDEEVKSLLADAYQDACKILKTHQQQLEHVASELLIRESIDGTELKKLIGINNLQTPRPASKHPPSRRPGLEPQASQ